MKGFYCRRVHGTFLAQSSPHGGGFCVGKAKWRGFCIGETEWEVVHYMLTSILGFLFMFGQLECRSFSTCTLRRGWNLRGGQGRKRKHKNKKHCRRGELLLIENCHVSSFLMSLLSVCRLLSVLLSFVHILA